MCSVLPMKGRKMLLTLFNESFVGVSVVYNKKAVTLQRPPQRETKKTYYKPFKKPIMARQRTSARTSAQETTTSANVLTLQVTNDNFAAIREALKEGKQVRVNDKVNLTGYIANTETISANGRKVRTPFYYVGEDDKKYTSYQLKAVLGIEPETKGERKKETFSSLYERLSLMADEATEEELQTAASFFAEKAEEKRRQAAKAIEEEKKTLIERLKALGVTI